MHLLKPPGSLNVTNIDASVAFYERAFSVKATKRRTGYAKFDLEAPSLNLPMQEGPRTGVNASHFGVQLASTEDVVKLDATTMHEDPAKAASACCAPSSLPVEDKPVQLRKKSGCC